MHHSRKTRGVALITVLMVLAVLGLITTTIVTLGSSSLFQARTENQAQLAMYAAEAGLWRAYTEFREDPTFTGYPETDMPTVGARYRVEIIPAPGPGPKGPIPMGLHYIHATGLTGRVGDTSAPESHEIGVLVKHTNSAYLYGLFAALEMDLENCRTHTWNSSVGSVPAGRRRGRAHVGTNSVNVEAVDVDPSGTIDGNIHVSIGAGPTAIRPDLPDPTGLAGSYIARVEQMTDFILPIIDMDGRNTGSAPDFSIPGSGPLLANGYLDPSQVHGDVTVQPGNNLRLLEGQIYYFNSITVGAGATIGLGDGSGSPVTNSATSRTVVKINHTLTMTPNSRIINTSQRADFLEFEINAPTASTSLVTGDDLGSDGRAYFILKAPRSDVLLTQGCWYYGAILANRLRSNDSNFFYDLNLKNTTAAPFLPGGTGENNVLVVSYQNF